MLLLMQCIELNRDGLLLLPTRDGSFLLLFHCGLIKLLEKSLTQALFILQRCQVWPRCGGSAHENCLFLGQTRGVEKKKPDKHQCVAVDCLGWSLGLELGGFGVGSE